MASLGQLLVGDPAAPEIGQEGDDTVGRNTNQNFESVDVLVV